MAIRIIQAAPETPKPVSVGEDVARSIPTGLVEGAASIPGTIGDLRNMGEAGLTKLANSIGDAMGYRGAPAKIENVAQPPLPVRALGGAVSKGLQALPGHMDPRLAKLAASMAVPGNQMSAPGTGDIIGGLTKDKPLYQPQTVPGQYARTAAQFAPAAIGPGGAARKLAQVMVPAVASEAAGQVTKGTPAEPYARVAAALLGGGATALVGRGGAHTRLLADASRPATDAQIAQARGLMERAQQQGIRLTLSEAVQQVTNAGTGMGRMQRIVEGTEAGNRRVAPVMAERPAQTQHAIQDFGNSVGSVSTQPSLIGPQAQAAGQGVLDSVRQRINELARPHYQAAEGATIPPEQYQALAADPAYAQAAQDVLGDPILGADLQGRPPNDLAVVDAVVKQLDRNATAASQTVTNPNGNNQIAAANTGARGMADDLASQASPEWREARDIGTMGRQSLLAPAEAGPVGQIAGTDNVQTQIGALYPPRPLAGGAAETADAVQALNLQNPNVAPALTRQHILATGNEAMQQNIPGENQWGGAKWAANVAGNPEQEAALQAGVRGSGGNQGQLDMLLEALRATGKRERPGSLTAYNARAIEELGNAGAVGEVMRTGLNPPGVLRRIGQGFQNWQTERNADRLAAALIANPADAERILLHAREVVPQGQGLETIERLALSAQLSRQPRLEQGDAPR